MERLVASASELLMSLPTRGAWIEIGVADSGHRQSLVAPHTGSVD